MTQQAIARETIKVSVTFEALLEAASQLTLDDKLRLVGALDEQILEEEEDRYGLSPEAQQQIEEARAAYEAGDYVTLDEYLAERGGRE